MPHKRLRPCPEGDACCWLPLPKRMLRHNFDFKKKKKEKKKADATTSAIINSSALHLLWHLLCRVLVQQLLHGPHSEWDFRKYLVLGKNGRGSPKREGKMIHSPLASGKG